MKANYLGVLRFTKKILVIFSVMGTSKILEYGLYFISTKLPKQDIIGYLLKAILNPLPPHQLPTTATENSRYLFSQPPL